MSTQSWGFEDDIGGGIMKSTVKRLALTGNEAVALAMRQIDPDVVAAYPITPATEIVQIFAQYVADGLVKTEYIPVESEHSALSACASASAAGARVMTATSSQGLALMHEILYITSGLRLPVVMTVVNRALSAPINIHCDHSDTMGSRDSGWIQIYTETVQEVYDTVIMAIRIAEEANIPVMVSMDGFITSHGMEALYPLSDEDVKNFIGERRCLYNLLETENPITVGPLVLPDYFIKIKHSQREAVERSLGIINRVQGEFGKRFGRKYGLVEPYKVDDAEYVIVILGSAAGTVKEAVDFLREKGKRVGVLRIRVLRPLPFKELRDSLGSVRVVGVMDRADSLSGFGGPIFNEVRSVLYDLDKRPLVSGFIYGLGGRDLFIENVIEVFERLERIKPEEISYGEYIGME
jgi:pyruvate ferredoxin oxidoreductase alpha subunit